MVTISNRRLSLLRHIALIPVFIIGIAAIIASNGGGGGGGTPAAQPITYSGNTSAAVITRDNAKALIANVIGGSDPAAVLANAGIAIDTSAESGTVLEPAHDIARRIATDSATSVYIQAFQIAAVAINETEPCINPGGSIIYTGEINQDGTGVLTITYTNCLLDDTVFNGSLTTTVHAFDFSYMIPTDATYTFTLITAQSPDYHSSMSGTIHDQLIIASNTEEMTMNLTSLDHNSGRMYMLENFYYIMQFDTLLYPNNYHLSMTGRVYDSVEGYVDVTTETALFFGSIYDAYPQSGGPLILMGANNAKIRITPISTTHVTAELDLDGDGTYESLTNMPWPMLTQVAVTNSVPVANAGVDQVVPQGGTATTTGSATDDDGDFLIYQWELTSLPAGSVAVLVAATSPNASFVADLQGSYLLTLTVSDGEATNSDTVTITVPPPITPLAYGAVDAEYSPQLNKVIMVSSSPDQLHIYDPTTHTETVVDLTRAPTSVSVSPDGLYAAVGHDALLSYVNLSSGSVEATHAVSATVLDIVLAGNGYAYAFPAADQWEQIRCINISTGVETLHTGNQIYAGTVAKLHPGGTSIYGADNGLSPSDIEKYSITGGTAAYLYDSPYHGDYGMCGDLWITESGDRIITRCGNTFNATDVQVTDMLYSGKLSGISLIKHLSHSSSAGQIAVIPENEDGEFLVYDPSSLSLSARASFPPFIETDGPYPSHGKFVFFIDNGSRYFTIVEEDVSAPGIIRHGVVIYDLL